MQYTEERAEDLLVLTVIDTRLEASNAQSLRELLIGRIEKGEQRIVLDLQNVVFMDSSALGSLIGAMKRLRPQGTLALAGATGPVLRLMNLTRMDKVFQFFPSRDAATAALEA
ncbi:STAS domain-containing protein [Meridianimarinicoccus sp. RP-17]